MDLSKLPIFRLPPREEARRSGRTMESVERDGYIAFRIGLSLDDCPLFVDEWMAASWRKGWRKARDERKR
jgi:ribosome modulation factor